MLPNTHAIPVSFPQTFHFFSHTYPILITGMIIASTVASVYTVGLIAVDRFLYIAHCMKYNLWMYPKRGCHLIVWTWILGTIVGLLPTTGLWTETTEGDKIRWLSSLASPSLIILITIIEMIPLSLVVILNGIILYHAIKKVIQLQRADKNRTDETAPGDNAELRIFRGGKSVINDDAKETAKNKPSKNKAVTLVLFTSVSLVFAWMIYFLFCLTYVFCDPIVTICKETRLEIAAPFAVLSFITSLLNCLMHAMWNTSFENLMKKLVRNVRKCKK
ncbi:adenosine receptor A1-like [Neodiprion lecontei]|uniref:Adenosine receptor A1-like n=1 Tax=Neodiprion lecontei TaxID=441921 RepID=A0ABM3GLM0_NEOLC|nr:adenosine receptor A1-like [Neodiprion lecontei]